MPRLSSHGPSAEEALISASVPAFRLSEVESWLEALLLSRNLSAGLSCSRERLPNRTREVMDKYAEITGNHF